MKPTVGELNEKLIDLVAWESLALKLTGIEQADVDKIKRDNPSGTDAQKQALFDKWLRVYPDASWEEVKQALKTIHENTIAEKLFQTVSANSQPTNLHEESIGKDIVADLHKLNRKFTSIEFQCIKDCKQLVETGKVPLSDLIMRAKPGADLGVGVGQAHPAIFNSKMFIVNIAN